MKVLFPIFFLCLFFNVFAQTDAKRDTSIYQIKARLIKAESLPPGCGVVAWALAQRFEIMEGSFRAVRPGVKVWLIQPCPEFLGNNYFMKNRIYDMKISENSGAPFAYTIINANGREKLLSFWVRDIKLNIQNN